MSDRDSSRDVLGELDPANGARTSIFVDHGAKFNRCAPSNSGEPVHIPVIKHRRVEMASVARIPGIVVATSIPPNVVRYQNGYDVGQKYQRDCIQSWIRAGFRVLSLNFPDEIPRLASQHPEIEFTEIDRDNAAILGRRTPLLLDIVAALEDQKEEIVGVVNADILLEDEDWTSIVSEAVQGAIAVAHRYDVEAFEESSGALPYLDGYDVFFFERKEIQKQIRHSFALGLPWWDYVLPISFLLRGLRVNLLTSPVAFHLQHPTNFNAMTWRYMAKEFSEFVIEFSAGRCGLVERDLARIIWLCQKVRSEPTIFEEVPRSLLERASGKLLAGARHLPGLWRLGRRESGQDARHRLVKACVAAISNSA
jgi:hypothetical protein